MPDKMPFTSLPKDVQDAFLIQALSLLTQSFLLTVKDQVFDHIRSLEVQVTQEGDETHRQIQYLVPSPAQIKEILPDDPMWIVQVGNFLDPIAALNLTIQLAEQLIPPRP